MSHQLEKYKDYYLENDRVIFTASFHLNRGSCCGNGCRHCPYEPKYKRNNKNLKKMQNFDNLIENVVGWAADKDILKPENASKQMLKVMEEVGETAGALAKNKQAELKDGIGDAFVTLIILAKQVGMEPADCLEAAWNEIKNRTGKTVNGVFLKD